VENMATPKSIMARIVAISRVFREHHKPSSLLREMGGNIPQLPNNTRWTSQRAAVKTFIENSEIYREIIYKEDVVVEHNICMFINDKDLLNKAKNMLVQLDLVAAALNSFQVMIAKVLELTLFSVG